MNLICLGGRVMGTMVAWDLVETFLAADFSQAERHLRRLAKVAALEQKAASEVGAQASGNSGVAVKPEFGYLLRRQS